MSTRIASIFRYPENPLLIHANNTIFAEGEKGNCMYVVVEGEVELKLGNYTLETVGPGEIIGEMALIDEQPRSASAIAKSDCKLEIINRKRFVFLLQETPFFAMDVMKTMADRLRAMNVRGHWNVPTTVNN